MNASWIHRLLRRKLAPLCALPALLVLGFVLLPAADHRDGPIFGPPGVTITNSRRDFNDIYVFQSPTNAKNTVLVADLAPFTSSVLPAVFDQRITVDIHIVNQNLLTVTDDITLRVSFSAPDGMGVQQTVLRGYPAAKFAPPTLTNPSPDPILAQGQTGRNLLVKGGGLFRAAEQDDPFFFDATGFSAFLNGAAFPRAVGTARNFFGQDATTGTNTLSCILEIPSKMLTRPGSNLIGVWVTVNFKGVQLDRMARPAINTALIPPVPRGSNFPTGGTTDPNRQERRNAFNAGHPKNDRRDFKADMVAVLKNFYGRKDTDPIPPAVLADFLLPDILIFDVTSTAGFGGQFFTVGGTTLFGNGRRLRDDVIDVELGLITNNAVTTDNVGDDNDGAGGAAPTDPIQAAFPYIGPPSGPNGVAARTPRGLPGTAAGVPSGTDKVPPP